MHRLFSTRLWTTLAFAVAKDSTLTVRTIVVTSRLHSSTWSQMRLTGAHLLTKERGNWRNQSAPSYGGNAQPVALERSRLPNANPVRPSSISFGRLLTLAQFDAELGDLVCPVFVFGATAYPPRSRPGFPTVWPNYTSPWARRVPPQQVTRRGQDTPIIATRVAAYANPC